jgi:hypothetical protein
MHCAPFWRSRLNCNCRRCRFRHSPNGHFPGSPAVREEFCSRLATLQKDYSISYLLVVGGRYDSLSSERRYDAGDFLTWDEALAAAQKIIKRSLLECWRTGMAALSRVDFYVNRRCSVPAPSPSACLSRGGACRPAQGIRVGGQASLPYSLDRLGVSLSDAGRACAMRVSARRLSELV